MRRVLPSSSIIIICNLTCIFFHFRYSSGFITKYHCIGWKAVRPILKHNRIRDDIPQSRRSYHMKTTVRFTALSSLQSRIDDNDIADIQNDAEEKSSSSFNLTTALFCAGLAFDAYSEPSNSSRWEKGPQGLNIAFQSDSFTRTLYNGLLEIQPIRVTDLPNQDDTAEGVLSGGGVDAYLLVAIAEGHLQQDLDALSETYNSGVLDLKGSAHAGRSATAWSNIKKEVAIRNKKAGKSESAAYHIPSTWTKGGVGVWEEDPPFYLYLQKPQDARIVFTVVDDNIVGENRVIGSAFRKLVNLIPNAAEQNAVGAAKAAIMQKLKEGGADDIKKSLSGDASNLDLKDLVAQEWKGSLPLNIIPKKKDKGGQVAMGTMAGAMVAGPAGAAVGGLIGNLYEGMARGKIEVKLRYLPIPKPKQNRKTYQVKGGLPGVDWGQIYKRHIENTSPSDPSTSSDPNIAGSDLELCVFVTHEKTGSSCAIYRSLEKKLIAISFRGTCAPIDLVTDASIVQTPWVEGVDDQDEDAPKVHVGFRNSLNSVSRRVKELILAAVAPGESLSDYSLIITGHSLGGALATLFATDVAEYGMDAGRGLPQLEPSAPWWSRISNNLFTKIIRETNNDTMNQTPPRPKDIRLYSFGSPRVGNAEFVEKFESLVRNGALTEAYRVVNGEDVVARLPRTVNALGFVKIGYEHCGATALIALPKIVEGTETTVDVLGNTKPLLWVEGESDNSRCPVRDGTTFTSPLADGNLLGDLVGAVKKVVDTKEEPLKENESMLGLIAGKLTDSMSGRMTNLKVSDFASVVGIDKDYVDREAKIFQSVFSGEAIGHHLEDQYYLAMGRASGFVALVGQEIQEIEVLKESLEGGEVVDIAKLD